MSQWSDWRDWEPSRPLPAEGGIAARSKRGAIGQTWWSQRFIALLESFGVGSRLQRGRNYARRGQVVELDVEPGIVIAKVQGSRYTPYRVRIRYKALSEQQWRRLEKAMASQALPLAQLLASEMPRDIEDVFASCKLTLFPRLHAELKASCTCPDRENPCKHIAAAYYILAERFDQD
ncbi:MAG: SWIM zinc finger family protein, partial [Solirubrobacteraceae bacterium]